MSAATRLLLIEAVNTLNWGFFVAAIGYAFYSGTADHITACTWLASGLVVNEEPMLLTSPKTTRQPG